MPDTPANPHADTLGPPAVQAQAAELVDLDDDDDARELERGLIEETPKD